VRGVGEPRTSSFSGEGGVEIHTKAWPAPGDPRATVVIAHGGGEHSGRYRHVAGRLNSEGYSVFALDHRGHGLSAGKRGLLDRLGRVVADLGTAVGLARAELSGKPLFLLGHSTGGCIALQYALEQPQTLDGLVLTAPLAMLGTASPLEMALARAVSKVAPGLGVFKVDASTVSRDPEVVRAYDEDPLVIHGKLAARTITELAAVIDRFPARVGELRLPLLVMIGTADVLVPPDAGRMVHAGAGSADKRLIEYEGLYHEILNEPEQEKVMDDLVAWLDSHLNAG
jgi:alpha-beta hydrolase superfamily lysophospholipase